MSSPSSSSAADGSKTDRSGGGRGPLRGGSHETESMPRERGFSSSSR